MKNVKKTQEECMAELKAIWPYIEIISEYKDSQTPITFKCFKCGHIWSTTLNAVKNSRHGCPKCGVQNALLERALNNFLCKLDTTKYEFIKCTGHKKGHIIVQIKCKKCNNIRETTIDNILRFGCKHCTSMKFGASIKKSLEEFITTASRVHHNKYDYSKTNYINLKTKVCIICPEHGEFWQNPAKHLSGQNCPKCKNDKISKACRSNTSDFIKKAKSIHGDKYDYSLVDYISNTTPVKIKCLKHGIFKQMPATHLRGSNCPKCSLESAKNVRSYKKEDFLQLTEKVHKNKYDYTGIKYIDYSTPIDIRCRKHGLFNVKPVLHINQHVGCPYCSGSKLTQEEFINRARTIHGNKYDYSAINYITTKDKIDIICPKHGIFSQVAGEHLKGHGCPICNNSRGEFKISELLISNKIPFISQYKIVANNRKYFLDFYITIKNSSFTIEFNGRQHYKPVDYFSGEEQFKRQIQRDSEVRQYCKDNNIKLFEIRYDSDLEKEMESIINEILPLLQETVEYATDEIGETCDGNPEITESITKGGSVL